MCRLVAAPDSCYLAPMKRGADATLATSAALVATAAAAYGLHAYLAQNVGYEGAGWFDLSVGAVPGYFLLAAIFTMGAVSVTDGFVQHHPNAIHSARNAVLAIGTIAALALTAVEPSYFIAAMFSTLGAAGLLTIIGPRRRHPPTIG